MVSKILFGKKISWLLTIFVLWVIVFVLQKPFFLLFTGEGLSSLFAVLWHGLPLDLSLAGYMTAVPGLLLLLGSLPFHCVHTPFVKRVVSIIYRCWMALAAVLVSLSFVANIALYPYWQFPLDATPLFYIASSPKDAIASVSYWQLLLGLAAVIGISFLIYSLFKTIGRRFSTTLCQPVSTLHWLLLLVFVAALFLPIRGGWSASTMNTGKAYFSNHQRLNHAAVNPLFSFMESVTHQQGFSSMYRLMDEQKAHRLVSTMLSSKSQADSTVSSSFLTVQRPDIYLIVLESFSDTLMSVANATPGLNRLKKEGVYFSNFYANSFRTDRGLLSILYGYPAPATVSLMKYPKKTAALTSMPQLLKKAGWDLQYYYGGDADFTNMRSYLKGTGFETIVCDEDFPVSERLSKWGAPDHLLFEKVLSNLQQNKRQKPWFKVVQTSSSHEPFDVPYHRLNDKILNAFAYTDSCVGHFVDELKKLPLWKNTLVVLVPDHLGCYPKDIDNLSVERYQIPLIFLGGALKGPGTVDIYGSQTDIAATLLGQMGIAHHEFTYSKDMFNPSSPHFAFFTFPDAFGLVDEDNQVVFNNVSKKVVLDRGKRPGKNLKRGKAYLQKIYDTIDRLATEPVKEGNRHEVRRQ